VLAISDGIMQAVDMALSYKPVVRDQLFLLPPDMREWLSEGHLAFFVLEVLEGVDTAELHDARRLGGAGRQAYDPDMLLGLLVYGYCTGERSSRRIERLCEVDVAFRVIASNQRPDHSTIARFRADNEAVIAKLFTTVLALCSEAGLVSLNVVAVDGTKMRADASKKANRTHEQLKAEAEKILKEAAALDAAEDELYGKARGDEIAEEFADRRTRKARIAAALEAFEKKEAELASAEEEAASKLQEREQKAVAAGVGVSGRPPRAVISLEWAEAELKRAEADYTAHFSEWKKRAMAAKAAGQAVPPRPDRGRKLRARRRLRKMRASPPPTQEPRKARTNLTDPDSHVMMSHTGWVQGYNAQAAVDEGGVVLSARVTNEPCDVKQCQPMMAATRQELDAAGIAAEIGTMLFDAGYCSRENLTAPGPDRLVATAKSFKLRRAAKEKGFATGCPPPGASPLEQMEHRLRTEEGMALYSRRQCIVEPAFGDMKENLGYRSFVRRGIEACEAEWTLICTAKNLLKLYRSRLAV
jgi:transposase